MNWHDIEGWFSPADARFVRLICSNIYHGYVVELGVFAGKSTAVMAPICLCNDTKYFAIDNFQGSSNPRDEATVHQKNRDIQQLFETNMEQMGLKDHIRIMKSDSSKASRLFEDNEIDFCFIDSDHSPVAVRKDIESWWPKIKKGGFLGGHDYPSPLRTVVDQFAKEQGRKLLTSGRCWAIQKGLVND